MEAEKEVTHKRETTRKPGAREEGDLTHTITLGEQHVWARRDGRHAGGVEETEKRTKHNLWTSPRRGH